MSYNVIISFLVIGLIIGLIAIRIRRKLMMKKLSTQLGNSNSVVDKNPSPPSEASNRGIDKNPIICPTCERICDTPTDLRYIGKTSICNECYQTHLRFINEQSVVRPAKKSTLTKKMSTQKSNYDYTSTSYTSASTNTNNDDDDRHRSNVSESSSSYNSRSDSSSGYSGGGGDTGGGGAGGDW